MTIKEIQSALISLGYKPGKVDGKLGPRTIATVKAFQKAKKLKTDGIPGPITVGALKLAVQTRKPVPPRAISKPVTPAPGPTMRPEQSMNWPQEAIKLYRSLGWSQIQATALTANLMWESGGNRKGTIIFDAVGDKGKSHGAGQWNETAGRFQLLKDFAAKKGKPYTDEMTQLLFLDHELHTTERRAGILLRASSTIEEAIAACIRIWRPGIPHAERRLAIARGLL